MNLSNLYTDSATNSYPIKGISDLIEATEGVGDWNSLCMELGVSESVLDELKHSQKQSSTCKRECLEDYLKNHVGDWKEVVRVIATRRPIKNIKVACKIAKKHMNWEKEQCSGYHIKFNDEL